MHTTLRLIIAILLFCTCQPHVFAKDIVKQLYKAADLPTLDKKQGYLMAYVNVEGTAPSLNISKIDTKKTDFIVGEANDFTRKYSLSLKNKQPGLYFIPMFEGIYQVTRVNAPFYDLPYWLDTNNQADWRFSIEAGKVNFIGEIFIAKERGTNVIDVHLFNRFATYKDAIFKEIKILATPIPFNIKPGYQDDFFTEFEK